MSSLRVFLCYLFLSLSLIQCFGNNKNKLKTDILNLARKVKRGLTETPEEAKEMQDLFSKLESFEKKKETLSNPNLSGAWNLEYTSSRTLIGKQKFSKRIGDIIQKIDVKNLTAENSENVSFFGLPPVKNKVTAKLTPVNKSKVDVMFDRFFLGPITVPAPKGYTGFIDVTYLDDDLRLTRGDKGNIFVLTKRKD